VDVDVEGGPVPRIARVLAGVAELLAALIAVWWYDWAIAGLQGPLALVALLTLAPQVARKARDFKVACRVVAGVLLVGSVVGVMLGLFLLLPSAVMLLAAGSRARPYAGRLSAVVVAAVTAVTVGGTGVIIGRHFVLPWVQGPDTYVATVQSGSPLIPNHAPPALRVDDGQLGHGARNVYLTETGGVPGGRLVVRFDRHTPKADLATLRGLIRDLPGVTDVHPCTLELGDCD